MLRNALRKRCLAGGLILAAVGGLALVAAAGGAGKDDARKMKEALRASGQSPYISLMWPEPPETPRIKAVDVLASEADLGRKITARESLMKFLTGATPAISRIYQPRDVAVSDDGKRVYSSDFGQSAVFVFDLDKRKVSTIPSERPFGIALDSDENLYVVEQENRRVVVLDRKGNKLRTITSDKIIRPAGVAIDRDRKLLYIADPARKASEEHSVKVFTLQGEFVRTIGKGKGDCQGCLLFPTYVALDKQGNVYVTSTLNSRVDVFDTTGNYLKTVGERGNSFGMFDKPKGVAVDSFGNIYVVDSGWSNVQIFNQKAQVLLYFGGRGDYPGLLKNPTGIAIDRSNRIYVADYLNYRITVYQLVNTKAEDSFITPPDTDKNGGKQANAGPDRITTAAQQ